MMVFGCMPAGMNPMLSLECIDNKILLLLAGSEKSINYKNNGVGSLKRRTHTLIYNQAVHT